jgi:hypothetical protein
MAVIFLGGGKLQGLSSDTKPTTHPAGATFFETDTRKTYYWNASTWTEQAFSGSSGGTPSIVYDPFYFTYSMTTDNTVTSNGLWRMRYKGVNPQNGSDLGQTGVRAPSGGAFTRVIYEYPYSNTNTGAGTSASLMTTEGPYFTDFDLSLSIRTKAQKRSVPETWETAWIMFRFNEADGTNFHHYYVTLKSNSTIEVGRKDNVVQVDEQYFLSTSATYSYVAGTWYKVRIRAIGNQITIWVDDVQKVNITDDGTIGSPPANTPAVPSARMYSGLIGLYNEDSEVEFSPMSIVPIGARVY